MNLPKGTKFIVFAGVAGLLATFAIHRYVTAKTTAAVKPTHQVVVALGDLSPGTALDASSAKAATWPQELVPPKAVTSVAQVQGRVLITPVCKGEPILLSKLAPEGTAAGLGGLLDESKRAITVRVDDVSGVAGFIHPGDHVDVLAELPVPGGNGEHFSKTILQNIVVLTAGQFWEQNKEQKPSIVNTVTLELTPEQGEVLTLASNQGKIRLALRSKLSTAQVQTEGVSTRRLIGGAQEVKAPPQLNSTGRQVEVIKGVERTQSSLKTPS
jgi:pilus assembly protein CpaB